eukprot:9858_1
MMEFLFWYITLSLITLCLFISVIIIILFVYRLYNILRKPLHYFIKYTSIICFIASICNIIGDLIHNYWGYLLRDQYTLYDDHYHIIIAISATFYYIATISLYSIIIYRLYTAFASTVYAMNRTTIIFIALLMLESIIEAVVVVLLSNYVNHEKWNIKLIKILSIVHMVIDITLNITVFVLFIKKLRSIIIDIDSNDEKKSFFDEINDSAVNNVSLNLNQKDFLDLMTRYTLLSCIAIILNQLFNSLLVFNYFYFYSWNVP